MARAKKINKNIAESGFYTTVNVTGTVAHPDILPETLGELPPIDNDKEFKMIVEPEFFEEEIRSVTLPNIVENKEALGVIQLIKQVGNMKAGEQFGITRIDNYGRTYFMNGNVETYFDQSEKGRLFVTANKE